MIRSTLQVELLSDACFSAPGDQGGVVDIEADCDDFGLPQISGKTLHGLYRDTWLACRSKLDPLNVGWRLLGPPLETIPSSILRIADARTPAALRQTVRAAISRRTSPITRRDIIAASSLERNMTAINREGAPKNETLRRMRVVPAGTKLFASLQHEELSADERLLFERLGQLTRHAGLHRNRGLGHVHLTVDWGEAQPAVVPNWTETTSEWQFVPVEFNLTSPAVFTSFGLDLNSVATQTHIPGAAIRGALARALNGDPDFDTIIASGSVRFLNAYSSQGSARALPSAVTLRRKKAADLDDWDRHAKARDDADAIVKSRVEEQRASASAPYHVRTVNDLTPTSPEVGMRIHQTRNRKTGVSKEGDTTVFVYESLKADQAFIGAIAYRPSAARAAKTAAARLREGVWLGRSGRGGYGAAPEILLGTPQAYEPGAELQEIEEDEVYHLQLTSPALVRNELGQHDPYSLDAAIPASVRESFEFLAVLVKGSRSEGYNSLWANRLPSLAAAAAGSVVRLRAKRSMVEDELASLCATPIGERTEDGFGCFTILKPAFQSIQKPIPPDVPAGAPNAEALELQKRLFSLGARRFMTGWALRLAAEATADLPPTRIQQARAKLRKADWDGEPFANFKPDKQGAIPFRKELLTLKTMQIQDAHLPEDLKLIDNADQLWTEALREQRPYFVDLLFGALAKRARNAAASAEVTQ